MEVAIGEHSTDMKMLSEAAEVKQIEYSESTKGKFHK